MQVFETQDRELFNNFLLEQNASVLQSWQWGDFQKKMGRKVWRLILSTNTGKFLAAATVVKMPLPKGKSYFYCPRGPVITPTTPHQEKVWELLLDKLSDLVITEKPIFLRVDPQEKETERIFHLETVGFKKIPWELQPQHTLILDLMRTEDEILHQMKPKTRYNINLAQRKGVVVERVTDSRKMKVFWDLMVQTCQRDKFSPYPHVYYTNMMEVLGRQNCAEMLIASYRVRPLAAMIMLNFGKTAWYLHGGSSDTMRETMAPHLLQWEAIKAARAKGIRQYDFSGIAPADGKNHPWAGLTRFKKGFGGEAVTYIGAYDLVYNKPWYLLYRAVRALNRKFKQ